MNRLLLVVAALFSVASATDYTQYVCQMQVASVPTCLGTQITQWHALSWNFPCQDDTTVTVVENPTLDPAGPTHQVINIIRNPDLTLAICKIVNSFAKWISAYYGTVTAGSSLTWCIFSPNVGFIGEIVWIVKNYLLNAVTVVNQDPTLGCAQPTGLQTWSCPAGTPVFCETGLAGITTTSYPPLVLQYFYRLCSADQDWITSCTTQ